MDAVVCFNRNPKDYAVGAIIEGQNAYKDNLLRVKENLVDGIYASKDKDHCYLSEDLYNP